jgi:hypothetical protein
MRGLRAVLAADSEADLMAAHLAAAHTVRGRARRAAMVAKRAASVAEQAVRVAERAVGVRIGSCCWDLRY